jgi:hypothetical protein
MDHVPETPEEIEAYVEQSKQVERLMEFAHDSDMAAAAEAWLAVTVALADKLAASGMSHVEVAAALGGMMGQTISEWSLGAYE